ncbi:Ligand-gated ion channel 50 [Penaeus vannamei]|uniref:Ligand-gated ion channel 50 n=1 Tax=Penaeus vannamei TaxID=6689 RepID=A0A3R7P2G1_PENVA|nr:Ligand-gated ion channel 50 [Penaeus vannamei]
MEKCGILECEGTPLVHLQTTGIARKDSGLKWRRTLPPLKDFTFCARFFSFRRHSADYLLSYAVPENDNEINIREPDLQDVVPAPGVLPEARLRVDPVSRARTPALVLLLPARRPRSRQRPTHHAVRVAGLAARRQAFLLVHSSPTSPALSYRRAGPLVVIGGGVLIIGQDQDTFGGGTSYWQSFNGLLADYFLAEGLLAESKVEDYLSCASDVDLGRPLLSFDALQQDFDVGIDTNVTDEDGLEMCKEDTGVTLIFPEVREFAQAQLLCAATGGRMVVPRNDEENDALFEEGLQFEEECMVRSKTNGYWLGIVWRLDAGAWRDVTTQGNVSYKNFKGSESWARTRPEACAYSTLRYADTEPEDYGEWYPTLCDSTVCAACRYDAPPALRVRGLCPTSLIDREYYVYGTANGRRVINGRERTQIARAPDPDGDGHSWQLSLLGEPACARRPDGRGRLRGDDCPGELVTLKLSSCGRDRYMCRDGTCIARARRCNLDLDCLDSSDEVGCNTVIIPDGYDRNLPPKVSSDRPARVWVDLKIRLVRRLELLDSKLELDMVFKRTWYDSRLRYKNLHRDNNLNKIDDLVDVAWYPDIVLTGSEDSTAQVDVRRTAAWGQLESEPDADNDFLIEDGEGAPQGVPGLEEATRGPLRLAGCRIPGSRNCSGNGGGVEDLEASSVSQQNKSGQRVVLTLTNLYGYYISAVYIPTFLLIIVSYLTFFFPLDDFSNRITVSLTSLLVLSALFSQVASGLPKTAYLKLIDIWFLFCIMTDFTMMALLVFINNLVADAVAPNKTTPGVSLIKVKAFENREEQNPVFVHALPLPSS